jgi:hypothetical protein
VRETRWTAALLIFATVALCALWTAGMMGATRTAWWPLALAAVFGCVVAFGLLVIRKTR